MSQLISPLHDQSGPLMMVNFSSVRLTAAQFERLCRDNPDLRLELTATGELIVMPPAGQKLAQGTLASTVNFRYGLMEAGVELVSTPQPVSPCRMARSARLIQRG